MKKLLFIIFVLFISNSLKAIELRGTFYQGNLIVGKIDPKSKVFIDKNEVKISNKGFLNSVKAKSSVYGRIVGVDYAEGFNVARPIGVADLFDII